MSSLNLQQSQICRSIGGRTVVPANFQGERTYELLAYYHPLLSFLPVLTYDVTSTVRHSFSPPLPFVSRKSVTWRCIEIFVHRQLCHWYVTKHHRHVASRWMRRVYRQIWKHCAVENFSSELQIRILTMTWLTLISLNGKTFWCFERVFIRNIGMRDRTIDKDSSALSSNLKRFFSDRIHLDRK